MDVEAILGQIERDEGFHTTRAFEPPKREELVVDKTTGTVRQAGTVDPGGSYAVDFRTLCERDLYSFAKGVMGMTLLTPTLHEPACQWLQTSPPRRKLLLFPRDHLKSSIVGRSLGPHILIQPKEANIYFPGCQDKNCRYRRSLMTPPGDCDDTTHLWDGANTRVLLGYETATNAESQLRWIENQWETNELLRALWPHKVWENARRQARVWNQQKMQIPRTLEYPEPSIDTVGVGGAVTGRHFNVHIFDDLCTLEAANSEVVMNATIEWFKASRALMDDPTHALEFTIGTRWAVRDLYEYMMRHDHTVESHVRAVVENGKPIFPEVFTPDVIEQKRKLFGSLFPLLYMNSAADRSLTDFDMGDIRSFHMNGNDVEFTESEADQRLSKDFQMPAESPPEYAGMTWSEMIRAARAAGPGEINALRGGHVRSA